MSICNQSIERQRKKKDSPSRKRVAVAVPDLKLEEGHESI